MADPWWRKPYDVTKRQIRLLRLNGSVTVGSADGVEELLACTVDTYDLDDYSDEYLDWQKKQKDQSHAPTNEDQQRGTRYRWGDYIALSYTWEPLYPRQKILVNGDFLMVAQNLAQGLWSLATYVQHGRRQDFLVWIDFLCINQASKVEMEQELKRMSFIFSQAYQVISYVGPESSNSQLVMWILKAFDRPDLESSDAMSVLGSIRESEWVAITEFLQRPYWRRMWVVQEMVLPRFETVLMCGSHVSRLGLLWRLVTTIVRHASLCHRLIAAALKEDIYFSQLRHKTFSTCARLCAIQQLCVALRQRDECDVVQIMNICRSSLQHDARDKVYSILGLLPSAASDLIEPDLSKSVHAVYSDLATALIKTTNRLDLLQNCRINSRGPPLFPTWTPDLTIESLSHPLGSRLSTQADGDRPSAARFSLDGERLVCRGVVLDEIDHLTPPQWPLTAVTEQQRLEALTKTSDYTIQDLVRAREILWRTLVGDRESPDLTDVAPVQYQVLLDLPWPVDLADCHRDVDAAAEALIAHGWCIADERQDLTTFLHFRERATRDFDVCGRPLGAFFSRVDVAHRTALDANGRTTGLEQHVTQQRSPPEQSRDQLPLGGFGKALRQAANTLKRRRLVVTRRGLLGASVRECRPGDTIAILQGCNVPLILRPRPSEQRQHQHHDSLWLAGFDAEGKTRLEETTASTPAPDDAQSPPMSTSIDIESAPYMVVGDCYVHGFMNGEAFLSPTPNQANTTVGPLRNFILC